MLKHPTLRRLLIAGLVVVLLIAGGWGWFGRRRMSLSPYFGSQQVKIEMPRMFGPDDDEKATPNTCWKGMLPWGGAGAVTVWADTDMNPLSREGLLAKARSAAAPSRSDTVESVEEVSLGKDAGFLLRGKRETQRLVEDAGYHTEPQWFVGVVLGRRNWSVVAVFFSGEESAFARNRGVLESCARTLRLEPP